MCSYLNKKVHYLHILPVFVNSRWNLTVYGIGEWCIEKKFISPLSPQGLFKVYPLPADPKEPAGKVRYFGKSSIKDSKPVDCLIRIYIVRGIELQPKDPNGKADPYIVVELGKKKISDKDNYIPNEINPYFGAYYEMKARLPLEKDLKIRIMDYDFMSRNDLIGETTIDLENRYYTSTRATCGLPPAYYT